ncbi:hypothetical protein GT020_02100 [Glutamicibacter soli]|uniref:Uncharacterized protein n=1 Tax=Glutamicibacter soli TaxID=453836 RepID=A0A6L9G302_9MICC|nr:hypothetical protein [Glutamicibacter soli]NAZ14860.1 hypothetical protein [Glutamicibacter soli]
MGYSENAGNDFSSGQRRLRRESATRKNFELYSLAIVVFAAATEQLTAPGQSFIIHDRHCLGDAS